MKSQPYPAHDLDDPDLGPLAFCAPFGARYESAASQQSDGWAVFSRGSAWRVGRCGSSATPRSIVGVKQQGRRSVVSGAATGGWTAWERERRARCHQTLYSYDVSRRTTTRWTGTGVAPGTCVRGLFQTRYAVVVAVGAGETIRNKEFEPVYRLRMARRP